MDVLVIVYQQQQRNMSSSELLKDLSKKAITYITDSFQSVVSAVRENVYKFLAILTCEDNFPAIWKLSGISFQRPTLILTKLNLSHIMLLNSWIESIPVVTAQKSKDNTLFLESLKFIDENLFESDLSLDKVASHIYVSKCHYSRLFQKNTGIGFKEYVMTKRIEQAKIHLLRGEPVTDVCYAVGYGDLTHFSRVFKKQVGINPSLYKQNRKYLKSGKEGVV